MNKDRRYLVYDDECAFCCGLACKVARFIDDDRLTLVPKSVAISMFPDTHATHDFNKNIHLIKVSPDADGIIRVWDYKVFVGGSALAETMSTKNGLQFLSRLNKIPVFRKVFDFSYIVLKFIRRIYNKLKG